MRTLTTILFCLFASLSLSAAILTKKDGKLLLVEFHAVDIAAIDTETIVKDFSDAFDMATQKKCNSIIFKDRQGEFYMIVSGSKEVKLKDKYLDKLRADIEGMATEESTLGEVIATHKETVSGPKFRIETYHNGKLYSTYESDWHQGYFPPETSTYRSGSITIVDKKMYVEPKYKEVNTYNGSVTVRTEGYEVLARMLYIIE